jgi:8-hydroxy-5-deazaflavin:NADPH oxidoreductase
MIGFCLAAGAGSRLLPLTRATPKPLLAPAGRPLVDLAVEALQLAGATRVVVNAHHGAELLTALLAGRPGVEVVVEPVLLGTGGGLVNAAHLGLLGTGDDPVLVTAADHVVDPADLAALAAFLDRSGAPMAAGLVPAAANSFGLRAVGEGWVARDPDGPWDSAGVYALRAGLLLDLEPGPATLVRRVLGPLLERDRLAGLPFRGPMADAGTLGRLLDVSAGLLDGRWRYDLPAGRVRRGVGNGPVLVAGGAEVDPAAVLAGPLVLDAGCRVGAGAVLTRAVVGPGADVGPGALVVGSFLGPGAVVAPGASATAALIPGSSTGATRRGSLAAVSNHEEESLADQLTIGLLGGTGPQGRGLALRLAMAGHRVLLGSRDPERAAGIVADLLGERDLPVEGVGNQDAAAGADVVFLVFPYAGQAEVLPDLAGPIGGKVVVDVINPLGWDQQGPYLLEVPEGSAAEQAAALLPRARVVAAFHHAAPRLLADPERQVETDVLVVGDDPAAKGLVLELADQIPGCRGVDAGPLRLARHLEGFTAVIVGINRRHKIHAGLRISRLGDDKRRRLNAELVPASHREEGP